MIRLALILALLVPGVARALSCLPHSVEGTYLEAKEADATYVIVRGTLKFDARKLPKVDWDNQAATPDLTRIDAVLLGQSFDGKGFSLPFERPVTLEVACFGPWCAKPPTGSDLLAFVRKDADGLTVATDPCGGFLFTNPQPRDIKTLKRCHVGGRCEPKRR